MTGNQRQGIKGIGGEEDDWKWGKYEEIMGWRVGELLENGGRGSRGREGKVRGNEESGSREVWANKGRGSEEK